MRLFEFAILEGAFRKDTGLATYDDMLKNPGYFEREKGKYFKITSMSPDAYLRATYEGFKDRNFRPESDLVSQYADRVRGGSPMPLPILHYELTEDGEQFSQEGRHRAYVAKELGLDEMPVMIVVSCWPPQLQETPDFQEFKSRVFSKRR